MRGGDERWGDGYGGKKVRGVEGGEKEVAA